VKKTLLVLLLGILGIGGYQVYKHFGPPSAPYRAYQRHATADVQGRHAAAATALARFGAHDQVPTPHTINYRLESQSFDGSDRVKLVALQEVIRSYPGVAKPEFLKTRHHVLLERVDGRWKVAEIEGEALGKKRR
jgi:hypothetical protein